MSGQIIHHLKNNPILLPHQIEILRRLFSFPEFDQFYLTGGTALSAFYLAHRESKDFDFFTHENFDFTAIDKILAKVAETTNSTAKTKVRSETYTEIYLEEKGGKWSQRTDFVRDIPVRFGKLNNIESIKVDSLENIAANKINAVFGRLEPKDYIDLYFIIKNTKIKFPKMFKLAQKKDLGINEFHFSYIIKAAQDIENFPTIKLPFDQKDFRKFYEALSRDLLLKIKPKN
ncbi:nucleotidyl transferase AbiEii/AbiGii toxin family protein [Candidatus Gottesmanbacteria bacterium]|nr:nucleotidyl transferase AbiEii/AbiGii toxin family protein [Candidatus Gottesmanbacteria bacterium]